MRPFGRIPGGADIGLGPLEHDQGLAGGAQGLDLWIGPGEVGLQKGPAVPFHQQKGEGIGQKTALARRNQKTERMGANKRLQDLEAIF